MSEVKNSTTDIDNNVQEETKSAPSPAQTPRKRMSRAEKARIESEELLKSLGVTMEAGRQTRSSRRGPVVESPKPEPLKRKQINTPRRTKKSKTVESDQMDGTNHVEESKQDEAQIAAAQTEIPSEPEKIVAESIEKETTEAESASKSIESQQQMEVDSPIESTQSNVSTQDESVPQSKSIEESRPTIVQPVESEPPKSIEQPEILESAGVSAAADTTTVIVTDSDAMAEEPPKSNTVDSEPIELASSLSDVDPKEQSVINSQTEDSQPNVIVELESSSNDGDEVANKTNKINSLDLELINSDSSSHSVDEVQIEEIPASKAAQEQPLPTSTVEVTEVTEVDDIDDETTVKTNNNAVHPVHTTEQPQNSVESTNNQTLIEIPEKLHTITVDKEETITPSSTSETLLQPNPTTA